MSSHLILVQDIFRLPHEAIHVTMTHENDLTKGTLISFLSSVEDNIVGVFAVYGPSATLSKLAFASNSSVLIITFKHGPTSVARSMASRKLVQRHIFLSPELRKAGFRMDTLAFSVFHDLQMRCDNVVDLDQSDGQLQFGKFVEALGGDNAVNIEAARRLFSAMSKRNISNEEIAAHAWLAQRCSSNVARETITTLGLDVERLQMASKLHRHQALLRNLVPTVTKNDIVANGETSFKKGTLDVVSGRFKTRIQPTRGSGQVLRLRMQQGDKVVDVHGSTKRVNGRSVLISPMGKAIPCGRLLSITTLGRGAPSNIEILRSNLFRLVLQDKTAILSNPFIKRIWFPGEAAGWTVKPPKSGSAPRLVHDSSKYELNTSQVKAVDRILSPSDKDRVVLVHGPPGTGKTTVIAAATHNLVSRNSTSTTWLVAHSNVAVKNIAEKLLAVDFDKFKLVVSKDFHYDWHEHLYHKVEDNVIRTDSLPQTAIEAQRLVLDSRVMLCTLTTLLNEKMGPITRVVPVEMIVVDEASQISIGDYIPVINRFQQTLHKLVFIGDHKQLAPHGSGDIKGLESIFEKKHLQKSAIMLDTQYRMPIPIGTFISNSVYDKRLKSQHLLTSWNTCRFIDVQGSKEESRGHSWINMIELKAVIGLARNLTSRGLSFKIITPYDPQRALLQKELQDQKLPYEDKCFNVDSFQGNEADYIIISLVRTAKLGFLQEDRRVNVMLTRCKKGMLICTNRAFIKDVAATSLVGKLAQAAGGKSWLNSRQVCTGNANPFV